MSVKGKMHRKIKDRSQIDLREYGLDLSNGLHLSNGLDLSNGLHLSKRKVS